jgi:hypothetical protein
MSGRSERAGTTSRRSEVWDVSIWRRLQILVATAVSIAAMLSIGIVPALASGKYP